MQLTYHQALAYLSIATLPGGDALGGPGAHQVAAIAALPADDRWPVLAQFSEVVWENLTVDDRLAILAATGHVLEAVAA